MSANNYAPPVTITVTDEGGTITLKGVTYARFRPGPNIYEEINQATTAIAFRYHKPVIAIAHSPAGTHTLIYTVEGEIREADDAALKDAQIDPSHYPPAAPRETPLTDTYTMDEALSAAPKAPEQEKTKYLLPIPLTLETPAPVRHVKSKIAIGAAVVVILIGMTGATYSLLDTDTSRSTHKGQSAGTVDRSPQSTYTERADSSQSNAPQSTKPQAPQAPTKEQTTPPTPAPTEADAPPEPQLEQAATSEPDLVPPPALAPPPSANPVPEPVPDYGITDLQTSVLTGGGGIVHVTFYLSGHGDTTATINIAGRSTTVTGTAPGSVGASVTGVPVGTHAWTSTADGLVNSGTVTVY